MADGGLSAPGPATQPAQFRAFLGRTMSLASQRKGDVPARAGMTAASVRIGTFPAALPSRTWPIVGIFSLDDERQVLRRERAQEVFGVEGLAGR